MKEKKRKGKNTRTEHERGGVWMASPCGMCCRNVTHTSRVSSLLFYVFAALFFSSRVEGGVCAPNNTIQCNTMQYIRWFSKEKRFMIRME